MDAEIVLRERREDDADAVARLSIESSAYYSSLAPELFAPVDTDGLVDWIAGDADWQALPTSFSRVAEIDGELAGYLEASVLEPAEGAAFNGNRDLRERRLFINYVVTAEAHRRKGVATRLVEAVEEWARRNGATVSLCDTYVDSPQSIPFWVQRMGYEPRAVVLRKRL